ncbi:MAG: hypothetical protein KKH44_07330 [Bacteroidetes bacterium]|nr:hypothetical protein [Bacteroidota bacterium]
MSYETIEIESENASRVHILTGTIADIDTENVTVDVNIDDYGSFADVPVFYHCEDSETADGMPFSEDDRVIIINSGNATTLSISNMKVVGFEDGLPRYCPVETVYILMTVGTTQRCFVWNAFENTYAVINKDDGNPALFPCDPADISDWLSKQTGAGFGLFTTSDCGCYPWSYLDLPAGHWGTAGNVSDSPSLESDCSCDFTDTGERLTSWDLTTVCYYWPGHPTNPENYWMWSGSINRSAASHIVQSGSKNFIFQNNSEVESAFKIELQDALSEITWTADGASCSGESCDNIRLDSGVYSRTYKYHTPLETDILEINSEGSKSFDMCNDIGAYSETNFFNAHKLSSLGSYSKKIIAQIYTVEARTITRVMNGAITESGCTGGDCTWLSEEYTASGLKITAQVGVFEDTDGIDPTGLSRNASFETPITEMYDTLRTLESIADDDIANAAISMSIYRG